MVAHLKAVVAGVMACVVAVGLAGCEVGDFASRVAKLDHSLRASEAVEQQVWDGLDDERSAVEVKAQPEQRVPGAESEQFPELVYPPEFERAAGSAGGGGASEKGKQFFEDQAEGAVESAAKALAAAQRLDEGAAGEASVAADDGPVSVVSQKVDVVQLSDAAPQANKSDFVVGRRGGKNQSALLRFPGLKESLKGKRVLRAELAFVEFDADSCRPRSLEVAEVVGTWGTGDKGLKFPGPAVADGVLGQVQGGRGYLAQGQTTSDCPTEGFTRVPLDARGMELVEQWGRGGSQSGVVAEGAAVDEKCVVEGRWCVL